MEVLARFDVHTVSEPLVALDYCCG
jgi:hypothetical protein